MDGGQVFSFPGRRRGSLIFHCGDGYYYHVRESRRSRARLQCRYYERGCPGTASVSMTTGWLHHLRPHTHQPDHLLVEDAEIRQALVHEARTNFFGKKVQSILNDFKVGCRNVELASRFTTVRMKSSLCRARAENYPNIPPTLLYLGVLLGTPNMRPLCKTIDGSDYIFQGVVGCLRSKTVALIFASGRMLQFLQSRKNLHCDGTFKKRSKKPPMAEIFNLVTKYGENIIAMVRVLMVSRTTEAYLAVLEEIKTLAPNLNPDTIHSDFDRAEMNAFKISFPRARVVGCIWHYAVACISYAHSLGLKNLPDENEAAFKIIRSLCGAALLPEDLIWTGVVKIWREAEQFEWSNELLPLFQYFQREWRARISELSVWGSAERTNNCSESDNHTLANVVPQNRPNVFHLIGGFVKLEHLAWSDKIAVDSGRQVTGLTIHNDRVVIRACNLLENREITAAHFLHMSSFAIHAAVLHGLRLKRRNNDSESDSNPDSD